MMNKVNIVALAIMCALPAHSQIIISETTEGSGNNKAIELTNISQENINLEQYTLRIAHNGAQDWSSSTLSLPITVMQPSQTYVIAHSQADPELLALADLQDTRVTTFNGDDIVGLFHQQQLIDIVGTLGIREDFNKDTSLRRINVQSSTTFKPEHWHSTGIINDWSHIGTPPKLDNQEIPPTIPPITAIDTTIMDLQGDGWASPYTDPANGKLESDEVFRVNGVITHIQTNSDLGKDLPIGFFIQDEFGDNNPLTSDAIFVQGLVQGYSIGDKVTVTGKVIEQFGSTQLVPTGNITKISSGHNIEPTTVTRLLSDRYYAETLERHEGMLVRFTDDSNMYVSRSFAFDTGPQRYNMVLAYQQPNIHPHQNHLPGSNEAIRQADCNLDQRLVVEATQTGSKHQPIVWYPDFAKNTNGIEQNLISIGDRASNIEGIIGYSHSDYRLYVTKQANSESFTRQINSSDPVINEGNIKIVTFNTEGLFISHLHGNNNPAVDNHSQTGFVTGGAKDQADLDLQIKKLTAAIHTMNSDLIALLQVENNGFEQGSAIDYLLTKINKGQENKQHYQVAKWNASNQDHYVGNNPTASYILYRPSVFKLNDLELLTMPSDDKQSISMNETVIATLNIHSKENPIELVVAAVDLVNRDQNCHGDTTQQTTPCDQLRQQASQAIIEAMSKKTDHQLILGSLHAYPKEKAALVFSPTELNSYVDAVAIRDRNSERYSIERNAESGRVDYIFMSTSLRDKFVDSAPWSINSAQSALLNYQSGMTFDETNWYRSSSHDPILLTLNLALSSNNDLGDDSETGTQPDAAENSSSGGGLGLFSFLLLLPLLRRIRNQQA
ncbi:MULTISPECIES: ExeM/NucH family extracellular endonuclease [Vibrio]|nr:MULTISPECIES: ExeM/NucH family extracellular endonuclease [Vibrio]MDQ2109568.1 ExeM/NucH family extracellular endonuclease [Vibrio sp. 2017_1457_15]MDQ2162431.1 ExeM/NucH family extracellular endonuclease [Vibrio sp. 2017_1457_13]